MFQFTGLASRFASGWYIFNVPGCPIRRSSDIMLVCSFPKLIAAYHVLHRLSEPRHPPYALNCFKKIQWCFHHFIIQCYSVLQLYSQYVKELGPVLNRLLWLTWCEDVLIANQQDLIHIFKNQKNLFFSGGYRSRTDDPLRARQML